MQHFSTFGSSQDDHASEACITPSNDLHQYIEDVSAFTDGINVCIFCPRNLVIEQYRPPNGVMEASEWWDTGPECAIFRHGNSVCQGKLKDFRKK